METAAKADRCHFPNIHCSPCNCMEIMPILRAQDFDASFQRALHTPEDIAIFWDASQVVAAAGRLSNQAVDADIMLALVKAEAAGANTRVSYWPPEKDDESSY